MQSPQTLRGPDLLRSCVLYPAFLQTERAYINERMDKRKTTAAL